MININLTIKGINELKRALSQAPGEMKREMVDDIKKSAYLVEGESKKVTPVDTGRLRTSIRSEISQLTAVVAPHTDYALVVHEGSNRMEGRPFMKKGATAAKKRIEDLFKRSVDKVLKSIESKTRV